MTEKDYQEYFQHIATTSKDIQHTAAVPGFFAFDFDRFVSAKRRSDTILFIHPFQGNLAGAKNDNPLDIQRVQWSVLRQFKTANADDIQRVMRETRTVAIKILARMLWHRDEDPDRDWCCLLQYFDFDEVEYRQDEIYVDDWTGYRYITPLTQPVEITMDPEQWL